MNIEPIVIAPNVAVGLGFVFLAIYFRFLAVKRGKSWQTANSFQKPSLDGRDAPMTLVWRGFFGGVAWLFFMVLFLACLFSGIDFIFFDGSTTIQAVQSVLASVPGVQS